MSKPELIKKVKYHFNLNIYESKVWLALLTKTIATVGEIAEISGVPRSRVYDVLESLEKRGFAIAKLGKPVKYIAVKPSIVIEHMKNNMLREAEEKAKNLTNIKESKEYRDLEILHSKGIKPVQVEDLSSSVKGGQNIYSHMKNIMNEAQKEIILISTFNALKGKANFLKPLIKKLKDNGVKIHIAASIDNPNSIDNKEKLKLVNLSKNLGVPIKRIKINARFCVADNSKLLVYVTPDNEEEDIAILINSPFFGKALTTFLSPIWRINK